MRRENEVSYVYQRIKTQTAGEENPHCVVSESESRCWRELEWSVSFSWENVTFSSKCPNLVDVEA